MAEAIALREADPRELTEVEVLVRLAYEEFREYAPETAWSAWMDNVGGGEGTKRRHAKLDAEVRAQVQVGLESEVLPKRPAAEPAKPAV